MDVSVSKSGESAFDSAVRRCVPTTSSSTKPARTLIPERYLGKNVALKYLRKILKCGWLAELGRNEGFLRSKVGLKPFARPENHETQEYMCESSGTNKNIN